MALTIDDLNSVTLPFYKKAVQNQIYEKNPLLDRLRANKHILTKAGGVEIRFPIRAVELGDSSFIDPDAARITTSYATRTAATFDWKYAKADVLMSVEERTKNYGKEQIVSLIEDKLQEGIEDLEEVFSDQLYQTYAATGTNDLTGLFSIIQDPSSTTTYGEISSADAASWVAGMYDTSTTTLAMYGTNSLDYAIRSCWFRDRPDLIVTTRNIASIYAAKLQPGERREPENGKAGATDLYFEGIPFITDTHVATGGLILLNTDHLYLLVGMEGNFDVGEWADDPDRYKALRCLIWFSGNLCCDLRKSCGAFTAISA